MSAHRYRARPSDDYALRALVSDLQARLSVEVHLTRSPHAPILVLHVIRVPEHLRGEGRAEAALAAICAWADDRGLSVALTPSGDFGASRPRLERWYRRHGFRLNAGRRRDFAVRETMIRDSR